MFKIAILIDCEPYISNVKAGIISCFETRLLNSKHTPYSIVFGIYYARMFTSGVVYFRPPQERGKRGASNA